MNARPCGLCKNLDAREIRPGVGYCWKYYVWHRVDEVVEDCPGAERADGEEPPGRVRFGGEEL